MLMLFALIGGSLVSVTHENTKETIRYNELQALLAKLNTIIPSGAYDNDLLNDTITLAANELLGTETESVAYRARLGNNNTAVILSPVAPGGYNGPIGLLVGIYENGTIAGVRVTNHRETPGLGDAMEESRSDWVFGFDKKSLLDPDEKQWKVKRDGGHFDQFTGATVTPRTIVKAVKNTLLYFSKSRKHLFAGGPPTTDTPIDKIGKQK